MSNSYLAIEITASRIRYLYLEKRGSGYKNLKCGTSMHRVDVANPTGLARAIDGILEKERISPESITISISRPETLIRLFNLPALKPQELEAVVTSEIEKNPYFANRKFDYVVHRCSVSKERWKVVAGAIDDNVLNYIISEVKKSRLSCRHVEITPLNLQWLLYLTQPTKAEQAILIINDKMSFLTIAKDGQYQLIYATAIGMDDFADGKIDEPQSPLTHFRNELQRVRKSYMAENKIAMVSKLWVVWDKDRKENFDQILAEQLGLQVEALTVDKLLTERIENPEPNPIYSLAATPLAFAVQKIKAQFPLDHFFRSFQIKEYFVKTALATCIFVAGVAVIFGGMALSFHHKRQADLKKTQSLSAEIEDLKKKSASLYQKRDEYLAVRQGLLDQATYVNLLNRVTWSHVLAVVAEGMPEKLCLTAFEFSESGGASFHGEALAMEPVAELIRRVDASLILANGRFDFLREKEVEDQKIFSFGILAQLKFPAETKEEIKETTSERTP